MNTHRDRRFHQAQRLHSLALGIFGARPAPSDAPHLTNSTNLTHLTTAAAAAHHCPVCLRDIPLTSVVCDDCPTPQPL
jgi:hypothetical protein